MLSKFEELVSVKEIDAEHIAEQGQLEFACSLANETETALLGESGASLTRLAPDFFGP